ncbi:MAG: SPOR domain-containing protein, partial [Alphaproteobacteria bacterium]|nr:SPOR domain-containing protein [Alphaproteobacteria bacterium]
QGTTRVKVEIMAKESKALKEAMLTGKVSSENAIAAAEQAPAPSLFESSSERIKIAQETEKAEEAEIYASVGEAKIASGKYVPTGKTVEPAVYGSAASADGAVRSGSVGLVGSMNTKPKNDSGIYAKAATNPDKEDTRAIASGNYEYMSGYYYIQTGSFSNYALAHKQMVRLKEYGSSHIVPVDVNGAKYYRVSVGPFNRKEEAIVAQAKLKYYGFKDTKVEKK